MKRFLSRGRARAVPHVGRRLSLWLLLAIWLSHSPANAAAPTAQLFLTRLPTAAEIARRHTRAKYEPRTGCYLGAFIDFDGSLRNIRYDQNRTPHHDSAEFEGIVGKSHAMYFFYMGYGRPLPLDWVRTLAQQNKFVHIALEPNSGLKYVKDDAYLRRLADDMKQSGAKIFLRFASEMNGEWTNYHKDPKLYREKFRLVHRVMHQRAPNVAMVWCPYCVPTANYARYYPGDDGTDWVGVNMYCVTFHNNHREEPAATEHPADLLAPLYDNYAARKPFMICEFASTHNAAVEGYARPDFAVRKIATLYEALPRRFPRVKCINYFDSNNMQFVRERAYNDYSVTDDPAIIATYRYYVSDPYFLSTPLPETPSPPVPIPLPIREGDLLQGRVKLSCWARSPSDVLTVRYLVDGVPIYEAHSPEQWECYWEAGSVPPGKHTLTLRVLRPDRTLAAKQTLTIRTAP